MRVLVAGATGALGVPLTRLLVARGHSVVGLIRHAGLEHEGQKRARLAARFTTYCEGIAAMVSDLCREDPTLPRVRAERLRAGM